MNKLLITIVGTVIVTLGGVIGLNMAGIQLPLLTAQSTPALPSAEVVSPNPIDLRAPTVEVAVNNILVPINYSKRQSLLLLDISLFTPELNQQALERDIPRIKNQILRTLSVMPQEYYRDRNLVMNVQQDLSHVLQQEVSWNVREVLVTKAVYQ